MRTIELSNRCSVRYKGGEGFTTIKLSNKELLKLTYLLGEGAGAAIEEGNTRLANRFHSAANLINQGNPAWTPIDTSTGRPS